MERRQTAELVDRIRLQRHRLARAAGAPELFKSAVDHARRHPIAWIVGGAILGAVSARLLVPGLLNVSRGVGRHWIHSTIQRGVVSLAHGALWVLWPPGVPGEVDGEWEDGPPDGDDAPLQATGGAIQPLRNP